MAKGRGLQAEGYYYLHGKHRHLRQASAGGTHRGRLALCGRENNDPRKGKPGAPPHRRRLVRQRTAVKTKRTQAAHQPQCPQLIAEGWDQQLALFDRQIQAIKTCIEEIINDHKGLSAYFRLLTSIPGIGEVTAW